MVSQVTGLLLLAAVLGAASASRDLDDSAAAGRQLLQTSTDCDRSVKHCSTCRYQFYRGTVTKAVCTKCEAGYVVKSSGRACYCAPGYYTQGDTSVSGAVGFTCEKCRTGAWCPGAKITADSSKARTECGLNKITTTEFGKSERECVVLPGFGWGSDNLSAACEVGYYNPGYNTRKCTKCPGSLTTAATNSNSSQDCLAGIGQYYLRGKAVACARGTYKEYVGNNDCDECPTGTTTPEGVTAASSKKNCTVLLPGYEITMLAGGVGVTNATECKQDYFRAGESNTLDDTASTTIACLSCGLNMVTLPNVTKATTADACLTPPGYGWTAAVGVNQGNATICPPGTYNPGYNREPCVSCGNGAMTTDKAGSTSADDCYTPAGHGNRRDAVTGVLEAFRCPNNTYGRINNTYGLVDVECTKCLDNTHTDSDASTGAGACLTNPGYGWDNGQVNQCDFGAWNAGGNQNPCTKCGDGKNTSSADYAFDGLLGATDGSECRVDFGYSSNSTNSGQIEPCLRGWFKDTIGSAQCSQCPAGTSTTITMAAVNITDCDTCRPGFGIASGHINVTDKTASIGCSICESGFYSAGFAQGGQACLQCPYTQNFTGTMVSRRGISTPEDCYGQFVTDDTNEQNFLWWDLIAMNDTSVLALQSGISNLKDCQDGCAGDTSCQYFAFYKNGAPDGTPGTNKCYWRRVAGKVVAGEAYRIAGDGNATWWNNPDQSIVLLEVKEGAYVVYPKLAGEVIGVTVDLDAASGSFKDMRTACDRAAQCTGLTFDIGGAWRAFKAELREDVIGKVRVVGTAINSWVNEPTGLEENAGWSTA